MKKILLTLGTAAAITAPVATVVACSDQTISTSVLDAKEPKEKTK